MRVGDYWLLVFLGEEVPGQYLAGDGDVYVAVLDDDFETMETIKVSDNTDGSGLGSARPSFARHMDKLLVAWDKSFQPHMSTITLDLVAFGLDEDDSGFVPPEDSDDEGSPCADERDTAGGGSAPGADDAEGGTSSAGLEGDSEDEFDEADDGEGIKEDPCDEGCGCTHPPRAQAWPGPASLDSWPSEDGEAELLCVAVEEGVVRF